jgi:hypothetical protein
MGKTERDGVEREITQVILKAMVLCWGDWEEGWERSTVMCSLFKSLRRVQHTTLSHPMQGIESRTLCILDTLYPVHL